jgi:hypothetical protein
MNKLTKISENLGCVQSLSVFLMVYLLMLAGTNLAFTLSTDHEAKAKAFDLYKEAETLFFKGNFSEAERKLAGALTLVPMDTYNLRFERKETRTIREGRWIQKKDVNVPHSERYYPNKLLGNVRMKWPPEPWATAAVTMGKLTEIIVKIRNTGKSKMENVEISISINEYPLDVKMIICIKPNEEKMERWILGRKLYPCSLKISFHEKYGFVPSSLVF